MRRKHSLWIAAAVPLWLPTHVGEAQKSPRPFRIGVLNAAVGAWYYLRIIAVMYLRTPAMHKPGSVWPTQAGTGVSKDVWMLGIGLGLMAGSAAGGKD